MIKKYATLQENITHWNVLREEYWKVLSQIRDFEEGTQDPGFYEFQTMNERPDIPKGKFLCHKYVFENNIIKRWYYLVDDKTDGSLYIDQDYKDEIVKILNDKVREKDYSSIESCISYKDDKINLNFAREGQAAFEWRTNTWNAAFQMMNSWIDDESKRISMREFIERLPSLNW